MRSCFSFSLIFFLQLALVHALLSSSVPNDASLIEKSCKKTSYHDLCVSALESNSNSSNADLTGLARIAFDLSLLNASDILNYAHVMINATSDPNIERPLDYCAELYIPVVKYTFPQGRDAFSKGQYKFAEYCLSSAAQQAGVCDKMLSELDVNLLGDRNKIFQELCSVTVALINVLLRS